MIAKLAEFSGPAMPSAGIAAKIATVIGDTTIDIKHYLAGLLCVKDHMLVILQKLGCDASDLRIQLIRNSSSYQWDKKAKMLPQTTAAKNLVRTAIRQAEDLGSPTVGTGHLLLAILSMKCAESEMLAHKNITHEQVVQELRKMPPE